MFPRKDSQQSPPKNEGVEESQSSPASIVPNGESQPETVQSERPRTRRVSGMKVALREVEITRGPKGQFVRRLKDILRKTHASSQKPPIDVDAYEPTVLPASRRLSISSSLPHLRKDVHNQSDNED
jgi:hypothetical protein